MLISRFKIYEKGRVKLYWVGSCIDIYVKEGTESHKSELVQETDLAVESLCVEESGRNRKIVILP